MAKTKTAPKKTIQVPRATDPASKKIQKKKDSSSKTSKQAAAPTPSEKQRSHSKKEKSKSSSSVTGEKEKAHHHKKRHYTSFGIYINALLEKIDKKKSISEKAVDLVNTMLNDTIHRIVNTSAEMTTLNKAKTINTNAIRSAICLLFPEEFARLVNNEGTNAVRNFESSEFEEEARKKFE